MREIKFRAWNVSRKAMISASTKKFTLVSDNGLLTDELSQYGYIIEQYIGLKDKNGKEIYEGDIVRILYTDWASNTDDNISLEDYKISISHVGFVEWRNDLAYYVLRWDEYNSGSIHHGTHGEIEIIGNIHKNPELLND